MSRSNRFLCLSTILALPSLFSCSSSTHHLSYVYAYGTTWKVHLYEGSKQDCDELVSYISSTSKVLDMEASSCKDGIYVLNHAGEVKPNSFLKEAVELGLEVTDKASGAYSITIGKLTSAWLTALEAGKTLEQSSIDSLLQEARSTSLKFDAGKIVKQGTGDIDLGSLGKGLCLRHIKTMLADKGITKYLINAGSSSLLLGRSPSGDGTVKITLEDAQNRYFRYENGAISTTSNGRQRYEIGGQTYSHIIDPRTGRAQTQDDALCLKGEDPALLDALSTAYLVLGREHASELSQFHIEYAFMKGGVVRAQSDGFFAS